MGINVAVTGMHATDNPAPGLGVIRSLHHPRRWRGEIIGLAYDVYDTGLYDRDLLDHAYMIPYPNQGSDQVFERLMYIHKQVRIDVLIPTLDSELLLYQKLESQLKEAGISMYIPNDEVVKKRAKTKLVEFCEENDIATPKTSIINDPSKLNEALTDIGYPLYVKGVFYDAYRCQTRDEALRYFEKLRQQWGLPILIQESVTGEEFDVCALGDRDGGLIGAVPIRRLRLTEKGKAWAAITLRNQQLYDLTKRTLRALRWAGPCELEIMQGFDSKKLMLLEINPRFPAWIYLGTGANQNLPKAVVDLAMGKAVKPMPQAKSGITFVRHTTDLVCPLEYVESLTMHGELHHSHKSRG
jgi:carbamoyl-phosphate synthase large subunit